MEHLDSIECHLCDDLEAVYKRSAKYATGRVAGQEIGLGPVSTLQTFFSSSLASSLQLFAPKLDASEQLIVGVRLDGFLAVRLLRHQTGEMPLIGDHRLLSAGAARQGIGMHLARKLFPQGLWSRIPPSVKEFLLDAAESVGARECAPIYPDTPDRNELLEIISHIELGVMANLAPRGVIIKIATNLLEPVIRQLGIRSDIRRWRDVDDHAFVTNKIADEPNLLAAVKELTACLHSTDVARSIARRAVFDLYPQHKRVLGLLEALIGKRLKSDGGGVAERWRNAFLPKTHDLAGHPDHQHRSARCSIEKQDSWGATLEIQGGWLIHAARLQPGSSCRLSDILDDIMQEIHLAIPPIPHGAVSLAPADPGAHAAALAIIVQPTTMGRRLLLHLGNIVVELRNFIEHGIDEPQEAGLLIRNADFWEKKSRSGETVFARALKSSTTIAWRRQSDFPTAVPEAAGELLLDAASLERCLTLITLVLHGAEAQLNIKY